MTPTSTLCTGLLHGGDLPERGRIAAGRRRVTCAWPRHHGHPSDRRFLAAARRRLRHLFPELPRQAGFKRRAGWVLEWLIRVFAEECPGFCDDLLLIDSTPVECGRSRRDGRGDGPWVIAATTAIAPRIHASFWGCDCTASSPRTARRGHSPWPLPKRDEREVGLAFLGALPSGRRRDRDR